MKHITFFLLCFVAMPALVFSSNQRQIVKNISNDFFTVEKTTQKAIPLFLDDKTKKGYLILNIESYKGFDLSFSTKPDLCVFVNNKLFYKSTGLDTLVNLSISSMKKLGVEGEVVVTFYSPKELFEHKKVAITKVQTVATKTKRELINRFIDNHGDTAIFLLLIVGVLGLVKNTDTIIWKSYFSFPKMFGSRTQADEYVLRNVLSTESLMLISLLSLVIACILNELGLIILKFDNLFFPVSVLNFILVFVLLLLKYLLLKMVSIFLNISSFGTQQFYEFVRYLIWLSFFILMLILVFHENFNVFSKMILWGGLTLWNIKILSVALTKLRFQKLYLFSYICASELIPAIVLINFIETIN